MDFDSSMRLKAFGQSFAGIKLSLHLVVFQWFTRTGPNAALGIREVGAELSSCLLIPLELPRALLVPGGSPGGGFPSVGSPVGMFGSRTPMCAFTMDPGRVWAVIPSASHPTSWNGLGWKGH